MADIFVSYTSKDRDWAFWIGQELLNLGHTPHVHEWEIKGGEDIYGWMQQRIEAADHMLCVTSEDYLTAPYSTHERNAAFGQSVTNPGFALIVVVKKCEIPILFAGLKRYELYGLGEQEVRARLAAMFVAGKPADSVPFPGTGAPAADAKLAHTFPGTISNVPINVPMHFLGRHADLAAIDAALKGTGGRAAITALHGLRGVGKTTLAAAYAERHRAAYRATWWIRAETEFTLRADLASLGVRLGWVATDAKEEPALATVMQRLRDVGDGILLVYDNANNAGEIRRYLPRSGAVRVIVTSNAPNWSGIAAPVAIRVWPKQTGADYLIAQAGRTGERDAALALSEALGGLPLAHEQAAAYCDRLGISLAEYLRRFEATPVKLLDTEKDAAAEYHDRITVARTFALAIDQAAKLHPAAEPLIVYSALLAPEPIPLYLFSEAAGQFGESFAAAIAGDGLDEAVATLRGFALVDRELVPDERDPTITTDCIRLHRLVRQVAAARREGDLLETERRRLIKSLVETYPADVLDRLKDWPRARRVAALAMALGCTAGELLRGAETPTNLLLVRIAAHRLRPLSERALAIDEKVRGPDHPDTAVSLDNLGALLYSQGDSAGARPHYERALEIREETLGPDHPDTALSLDNLGYVLRAQGNLAGAWPYFQRALAIREKALGPDHPDTAMSLNILGALLQAQGDLAGARPYYERALAIYEKALGPDHPYTAMSLNNLGALLQAQGDLAGARPYYERALAIREKALGSDHPDTARSLYNLGYLLQAQGDLAGARPHYERALATYEKAFGPDHPDTATSLNNLGYLLQAQGDLAGARPYYERALAIFEKVLGPAHPSTKTVARNAVKLLEALKCSNEANALREKFGVGE